MLMTLTECLERYDGQYRVDEAIRTGRLKRLAHGLYSDGARHRDIEVLQKRYPTSVVTMLSAYYYYDLTDQVPDKCHLAVERGGSKINDPKAVEYFVPKGTGTIGVCEETMRGVHLRIYDKERLLIETVRLRTKLPYELYREVIGGFRRVVEELYPAKMEDYLESFPKRKLIFDIIKREVL